MGDGVQVQAQEHEKSKMHTRGEQGDFWRMKCVTKKSKTITGPHPLRYCAKIIVDKSIGINVA